MTSHARLHVMLAREASVAVVLRRGPSRQVGTLLWNRKTDTFTFGQWLKGKIYEFRGDISPDGTRWLYMAMKGGTPYTAIAAPPYLKALCYVEHDTTYSGGGFFLDNRNFCSYGWSPAGVENRSGLKTADVPIKDFPRKSVAPGWSSYRYRLHRDGWEYLPAASTHGSAHQKRFPNGWTLRKSITWGGQNPTLRGSEHEEHLLTHESGKEIDGTTWEWADWEPIRNRFAWAAEGKLFAAKLNTSGLRDVQELYDFNPLRFQAIEAPY